jgi:hypothetical protein
MYTSGVFFRAVSSIASRLHIGDQGGAVRNGLAFRVAGLLLFASFPADATAQLRGQLGAFVESYTVRADDVDGTAPAAGVAGAVSVHPLLDLEAEVLRPAGAVQRQYTGISFSFAPREASREEIARLGVTTRFTRERRVASVVSFGAAFHPRNSSSRVQPRLFTGVTTHFVRERALREPLQWPATVTLTEILRRQPAEERHRRAIGSITVGAGLAIALTERLVIMPGVRYDYGSIGDEINDAFRAGVRVLWRF